MADFNLPFASNGERREPTADEQDSGFGCGPAQLPLFNWMFYALQAEINKVMLEGGITPSNGDMTQLWQAIQAMIDASTGGGDPATYLLVSQARARLPIFPEVLNTNGHFGVTSPGTGQVRIPAGVNFQHRGIYPIATVQTDLATDPSKTYHLRWNPTDGFALKDLASVVYNPSTLAETVETFDSAYDDMLCARVITNSSNVPTITNLINRNVLRASGEALAPGVFGTSNYGWEDATMPSAITHYTAVPINFARRPDAYLSAINDLWVKDTIVTANERNLGARCRDRYNVELWAQGDSDQRIAWVARA